jgi:rSAM/selenodomain-associated transferase 2/rSAM/selenodomain-associated transferase 1
VNNVRDAGGGLTRIVLCERIIIFARFPEPGQVKTRLIPAMGRDQAARLQTSLTRRTLDVVRRFCAGRPCNVELRFSGGDVQGMRNLFGTELLYSVQVGNDLGERLKHAVAAAFEEGAKRVVVIGTDCPEIEPPILLAAIDALKDADVVLGPAFDGGYYLIGLRANHPEFFQGIDWGTENVLRQTLEKTRRLQFSVRQLKPLSDVDYPEDLIACRRVPDAFEDILPSQHRGVLSIIIPTLNEERVIEQTLASVVNLAGVEVIVADGGSTDATVEIVRRSGVRLVPVRPGRGRQMNAGAAIALGEVLLFLHADTNLPDGFMEQIWSTLDGGAIAGAFHLSIDDDLPGLRWIEWGANLRSRYLQLPYGDQGLFMRSEQFHRVGGFPNWPLMEDYELSRRLSRHGRIRLAPGTIGTSSRRWRTLGIWRTTLINQICVAGFHLGVSPEKLAQWYSSVSIDS